MEDDEFLDYFIENKDKKYLFAFLDILGYSSKVRVACAEDNFGSLIADLGMLVDDYVQSALEVVGHIDGLVSKVQTMIFSDSFCLYWEIGDYTENERDLSKDEFRLLFNDVIDFISDIQIRALSTDVLFRGALAIGRHFKKDNVTVSEALVKAHDTECGQIIYPRIGIDLDQGNEYFQQDGFTKELIDSGRMIQEEKILYIDYLGLFNRFNTLHPYNSFCKRNAVEGNKECYETNIKLIEEDKVIPEEKKQGIRNKYSWLQVYHNKKCDEFGYNELMI